MHMYTCIDIAYYKNFFFKVLSIKDYCLKQKGFFKEIMNASEKKVFHPVFKYKYTLY